MYMQPNSVIPIAPLQNHSLPRVFGGKSPLQIGDLVEALTQLLWGEPHHTCVLHKHTPLTGEAVLDSGCVCVCLVQEAVQLARNQLEEQKAIMLERNRELHRWEAERREHEKEKCDHLLVMKEVEHQMNKFNKDNREAASRVIVCLSVSLSVCLSV